MTLVWSSGIGVQSAGVGAQTVNSPMRSSRRSTLIVAVGRRDRARCRGLKPCTSWRDVWLGWRSEVSALSIAPTISAATTKRPAPTITTRPG